MSSRALILASVLLFVNGCDYSQKKPQVSLEPLGTAVERGDVLAAAPFENRNVLRWSRSDVIER